MINQKNVELSRRQVKFDHFYEKFMGYGDHIACVIYDFEQNVYLLEIYDKELTVCASKKFNFLIKLCFFNDTDIVCFQNSLQRFLVFDYKLNEETAIFDRNEILPLTITSTSAFAVNIDADKFYIAYFDYYQKMVVLRTITRDTKKVIDTVNLDSFLHVKSVDWLRFDSNCNICLKYLPGDKIKCFNKNGKFLTQNSLSNLKRFEKLQFTKQNDLFFFNILKAKLYFI
jgi:hypothetical protein